MKSAAALCWVSRFTILKTTGHRWTHENNPYFGLAARSASGGTLLLSGGRLRFDQLDTTFVRLETDAGIEGWGSCPCIPIFPPMARASVP